MQNILVIIPARGGSKGIPRKNLRNLNGKPLIYYSITTALSSEYNPDVYVSTEDNEIAAIAKKLRAKVINRDVSNAQDHTTLDPVIFEAYTKASLLEGKGYDLIVTLQPTSPLLTPESLDSAIGRMIDNPDIDTILSVKDDTHLTWKKTPAGNYVPNYAERVNRQYLDPVFKETGGFLICRSRVISHNSRIGSYVDLYSLDGGEEIDIDTHEDWNICEYYLRQKKILFVVSGYKEIGLGHVYNTLLIANDILRHQVQFLVDKKSKLAFKKITSKNYNVHIQTETDIASDIKAINPDVVINDCLDTDEGYIKKLKKSGFKVVNFEDLGSGARYADLVINAIYPEIKKLPSHYFGEKYFVLRDEFLLTEPGEPAEKVKRVLLTFGGVDPNNFTSKVLAAISAYCLANSINISVVTGFGYSEFSSLKKYQEVKIHKNTMDIAQHMSRADIIFTSAGRTTYETASLHVPTIVLAQNDREMTHFFASEKNGFLNLGLGNLVSEAQILLTFQELVEDFEKRSAMAHAMAKTNLRKGRKRVLGLIHSILESE